MYSVICRVGLGEARRGGDSNAFLKRPLRLTLPRQAVRTLSVDAFVSFYFKGAIIGAKLWRNRRNRFHRLKNDLGHVKLIGSFCARIDEVDCNAMSRGLRRIT